MRPPERIETERLILRKPRPEDAEAIFADYAQDPEVTRYLPWAPHTDLSQTRVFVHDCLSNWDTGDDFTWVITSRDDDQPIGALSLRVHGHKADIGYVLARSRWGRGLMPEAALAIVGWALGQPEIFRVWAVCDVANAASARVLEKCGMTCEGTLRRWMRRPMCAEPVDCLCYAITR
jgi:RimJ/RimL family protein N-acetyltransferase